MKIIAILLVLASTVFAQAGTHSNTLNWLVSSTPSATYTVKKSATPGGARTVLATGLTVLTYVDGNLPGNQQGCYAVTAISATTSESDETNEVCVTSIKDKTAPPGTLTVTQTN